MIESDVVTEPFQAQTGPEKEKPAPLLSRLRERVAEILQDKWFQITVVILAALDGLLLVIMLILEIERLQSIVS